MFFKKITQYVAVKAPEWKHIPTEARNSLNNEYAEWYTAYALTFNSPAKAERDGRRAAYKKAAKAVRNFVNQYLRFPPVTNADRTAIGIPNHDETRSRIKAPDGYVEFSFRLIGPMVIAVYFKVKGSKSKAKPYGCAGAQICWGLQDKPAASLDDLNIFDVASGNPFILRFKDAERAKFVSVAMRWVNGKFEKGPWSAIQATVVP